jgi:hypothetical protein
LVMNQVLLLNASPRFTGILSPGWAVRQADQRYKTNPEVTD